MRNCVVNSFPKMILVCAVLSVAPVQADVPAEIPLIQGTIESVDARLGVLQVREGDGTETKAVLAHDANVVVGKVLPHKAVKTGEMIAVNATDINLKSGRLLVAELYLQADSTASSNDRERELREFLPASGGYDGPNGSAHTIISGKLISLQSSWMVINSNGRDVQIKISPEARGLLLRPGAISDLHPGATVTMALPAGGVRAVLVTE